MSVRNVKLPGGQRSRWPCKELIPPPRTEGHPLQPAPGEKQEAQQRQVPPTPKAACLELPQPPPPPLFACWTRPKAERSPPPSRCPRPLS